MEGNFEKSINRLNEVIGILNTVKNDSIVLKSLCAALNQVLHSIENTNEAVLVANTNLSILEEVCSAKSFTLSQISIKLLVEIYRRILTKAPGYAVRNVVSNLLALIANKTTTNNSRECAVNIIGEIIEKRAFDCGSLLTDIVQSFLKLLKGATDISLRVMCLKALNLVVIGGEFKLQDIHAELGKTLAKLVIDKNPDLRQYSGILLHSIVKYSSGCSSIPADTFFGMTSKGLEDENVIAQDIYCRVVAAIYVEQINAYTDAQEKAKIGSARGESGPSSPKAAMKKQSSMSRLSITKLVTSSKKPTVEEFTFRSIVSLLIKNIVKYSNILRTSHLAILGHVIAESIFTIDPKDYEWIIITLTSIFRESPILSLPQEDKHFFRSRMSLIVRNSIVYNLTEALQLSFATELTQFAGGMEQRNDDELYFVLNELGHLVKILGEFVGSIADEIHIALSIHLRHSSFSVRSAAANVYASLAHTAPAIAAKYVSSSLASAQEQVRLLTAFENGLDSPENGGGSSYDDTLTDASSSHGNSAKRKTPKEMDRLQKMYCFHGHTLVISNLLSNHKSFATGFPKHLIMDLFDFGLSLLKQDVLAAPPSQRHVACSIVRAGSLILSSCLYLGYYMNRGKLVELLSCCDVLIKLSSASSAVQDDELLFELMTLEGALVCISTILWYCPEVLLYESICLDLIVDDLDIAFRTIKSKYQSKFRTHFRFRTLHVILLECYAWLPPGSFAASCQLIFVEALRLFRDSITAGHVCSCLHDIVPSSYGPLISNKHASASAYGLNADLPLNEQYLMLKLESYATALQKKESEAVLGLFGKDCDILPEIFDSRDNWYRPSLPSSQLDIRVIDASIMIISATFCHQTTEYRIKAMQLFSQAVTQCLQSSATVSTTSSSSSSGIFSSNDEEKKRKEKKNFVTIKNVTAALVYIVRSLPKNFYNPSISAEDISWLELIIDRLIDLLGYIANIEIRCAAALSLNEILSKLKNEGKFLEAFIENLYTRIHAIVIPALDRKNETMVDYGGYLLAFGALWRQAPENSHPADIFSTKKGGSSSRDRILTCILDCLRRVDTAVLFRAHGIMALCDIMNHMRSTLSLLSIHTVLAITVNTCTILDIHSSAVFTNDDYEQLQTCILTCLTSLSCLAMTVYQADSTKTEFKDLTGTCCRIWDSIQGVNLDCHPALQHEMVIYLAEIVPWLYPSKSTSSSSYPIISEPTIIEIVNQMIASRYSQRIESLLAAVNIIRSLILHNCDIVVQVKLYVLNLA
jgi:uncharacterized protein (UPF0147 family)